MIEIGLMMLGIVLVAYMIRNKVSLDFPSFLDRTLPLERGVFGVYSYNGKQGSGKTYSLVKYVLKHQYEAMEVYSNMHIEGLDYTPITSVEHLFSLRDKEHCFIIYDEIFTLLQKSSKIDEELMEFLTQQRKMKNILFTTAQEWLEIPITFRRFVRIAIDCNTRPLGRFGGILIEVYRDGYRMKWDNDENEYIAPIIRTKISKYQKRYMVAYDTFARVKRLKR
ncbi:MAG: zonular occludens toxin [Inoviridae sp.]|nr:MAG: zonular occludens toxin [Inoviridae sp.]